MSFEWKKEKLGDLLELIIDHRGKTPKKMGFEDFHSNGYPVLSAKHVKTEGLTNLESMRFANESLYQKWMKDEVQEGDVILTSEAPLGELYYVSGDDKYLLGQRVFGLRPKKCLINPLYLFSWLASKKGQEELHKKATGSTVQGIKQSELLKVEVDLPPYSIQQYIAGVHFSLKEKIKNNKEINQNLEQMAQALFKSWFVDFEPVKAKMAVLEAGGSQEDATLAAMTAISGKDANALAVFEREQPEQYAELKATAELFPSAMQDSELGEIPEGWELKSFGDVSKCYDKKRIPLSKPQREKKKGEIPYYGATSIMDYVDEYIFDGIYLLLGEDGSVIKENGLPFTQYIWGKSWVNNHAHVLTGSGSVTTEHLMVFIKQENIAAYVTGAVQMKLNQKNMNSIPFIFADEAVNNVFGQRIDSIYAVIRAKSEENLTLTNLRDTLLPKLLSGEITLPEAEQIISEEA